MSPLTVPFSTTCGASIEPSIRPCSLTDTEALPPATRTLPGHAPVDVQAAGEFDVALDAGAATDQRVDAGGLLFTAVEHGALV